MSRLPLSAEQQRLCETCIPAAYRLAVKLWKASGNRLELDEVQSEAMFGLVHAAETYQPDRGASFLTWTYRLVWQHLIQTCKSRWNKQWPNQMPAKDDGDSWEPACRHDGPEERAMDRESNANAVDSIAKIKKRLTPRLFEVLRLRDVEGLTLVEIGKRYGLCKERVRQIHLDAKAKAKRIVS